MVLFQPAKAGCVSAVNQLNLRVSMLVIYLNKPTFVSKQFCNSALPFPRS